MIKEACIESYDEALIAEKAGAHRIELCSNINLDGITPKKELIKKIITSIKIPVRVMIRPRDGDFNYSEDELKLMEKDINICNRLIPPVRLLISLRIMDCCSGFNSVVTLLASINANSAIVAIAKVSSTQSTT